MVDSLRRWGYLLGLLAVGVLGACGGERSGDGSAGDSGGGSMARIEGSVLYRERMMLPPGAEVEVQLQDISKADAMATVMASVHITPEGGPPYPFAIEYDPATIDSRMRYALRATITHGDSLMFASTDYIDAFGGNPVEVLVRRMVEPVKHSGPQLTGQAWELQTLLGEAAPRGAGDKVLTIEFQAQELQVGGFSGCNRYSGSYSLDGAMEHGSALQFGLMASTMMACADSGDLEQTYLQMLGKVSAYRLAGDTLSLLSGPDILATYRAL
jgi:putative lipoprotein